MKTAVHTLLLSTAVMTMNCQPLNAQDDGNKARQIIDRAVKAMGGPEALEKSRNMIVKDEGTYFGMGDGLPYKGRYVYSFGNAGRYRMEILGVFVQVMNRDKGWMEVMGNASDLTGETLKVTKQTWFTGYVTTLLPLQKPDKAFQLSLTEAQTVDGEECDGVTVKHEQMPELTMYFSRKTGLLKKTKYVTKVAELGFQEAEEESIYREYKDVDGVMSVTKLTSFRDGKKFVEANLHDITFPASIDDSEFKKPE